MENNKISKAMEYPQSRIDDLKQKIISKLDNTTEDKKQFYYPYFVGMLHTLYFELDILPYERYMELNKLLDKLYTHKE